MKRSSSLIEYSRQELLKYDGSAHDRKLIAFQGIVYDVTDCPKWQADLHENQHFPGQDLTDVLSDAPHNNEVFNYPCVQKVGTLQNSK